MKNNAGIHAKLSKIRIAVIGMNFGQSFAEIYKAHPDVEYVGVCDTNKQRLASLTNFSRKHDNYREILESGDYDAVHICTPATMHVEPALEALKRGRHVACAVPMAMSLNDLNSIIAVQEESGLNYMMMETAVYGNEYLYANELYKNGTLGMIQFMRGCHSQDLEDINPIWQGLPPMWYMTHAIAPLLDILDTQATEVHCYGSGVMREEFKKNYGNPYPIETAIFKLKNTMAKAEITRTLFETAPYGGEAFDLYGDKATFATIGVETPYRKHGECESRPLLLKIAPLLKPGERRKITGQEVETPFRPDLLPEQLKRFANGGHRGSHPHLVHEFIRSIIEGRQPYIHARRAANWCAPGICAHESAMKDGAAVEIPSF